MLCPLLNLVVGVDMQIPGHTLDLLNPNLWQGDWELCLTAKYHGCFL